MGPYSLGIFVKQGPIVLLAGFPSRKKMAIVYVINPYENHPGVVIACVL